MTSDPFRSSALALGEAFADREGGAAGPDELSALRSSSSVFGVASQRIVARALEHVLHIEQARFSLIWERASAAQRLVLAALAAEQPAHPLSEDYQVRHGLPRTPTVQTALGALVRGELVARSGRGRYRIAEPFLAEWISRAEG